MSFCIAVDGPAGAGKSTIAKVVAKKLGIVYVDTGAMYRAMAYYLLNQEVDFDDTDEISEKCVGADISIQYVDGVQQVILNGENVNAFLRIEAVGKVASKASVNGEVRKRLVLLQQRMAEHTDLIMDGRDIGTCVLPNAELKIYLTASTSIRAKRRYDELVLKGEPCNLEQIEAEIIERDYRDMNREISPLKQADDAILLDTSNMTTDEVIQTILNMPVIKRNYV
ncbi:MAG: (d)CMP kinase [Lachnospiraceae bacterium]